VTVLDLVLLLILGAYAISGLRQGFVASVLSLAGFLGGAALAMWALPGLVDHWSALANSPALRAGLLVACVVAVASMGQALGVLLAHRLKSLTQIPVAKTVDGLAGMVAVTVATSLLMWFVAGALRVGGPEPVSRAIAKSTVLRVIDGAMPDGTSALFASFRQMLDREGFPQVFQGIQAEPITPVDPPSAAVTKAPGVVRAAASIVKITGVAQQCGQVQEGSGWVSAPGQVVTNAHVVAGLGAVSVQVRGTGQVLVGRVVVFDPQRDLAVVDVPGLTSPALGLGSQLVRGDDAVVAGFPGGGAYAVGAARIRSQITATGADIYGQGGTVRRVYSLNAVVRPGNSGGPLLGVSGRVEGVVFARSLDDPHTGYALTLDELRPILQRAVDAHRQVSTGACVIG
jgi:S1-C subfamily serine protease